MGRLPSPPPHLNGRSFFHEISDDLHQLKIPQAFWNDTKEALSPGPVILRSRVGRWAVKLYNHRGNVYLRSGWTEFLEENELGVGDCLLFTHLEGSLLQVEAVSDEMSLYEEPGRRRQAKEKTVPVPAKSRKRKGDEIASSSKPPGRPVREREAGKSRVLRRGRSHTSARASPSNVYARAADPSPQKDQTADRAFERELASIEQEVASHQRAIEHYQGLADKHREDLRRANDKRVALMEEQIQKTSRRNKLI